LWEDVKRRRGSVDTSFVAVVVVVVVIVVVGVIVVLVTVAVDEDGDVVRTFWYMSFELE
jgi:uncharacterized membrane protein YqiK